MPEKEGQEWRRRFVFLLKFNTADLKDVRSKLRDDAKQWGGKNCEFLPVAGEYDMVVRADEGTMEDAFKFTVYLTNSGRYTVSSTLTVFTDDEFQFATGEGPDPHRRG